MMPTGPNGEKRPADLIANAVLSMKVATGEAEEVRANAGRSAGAPPYALTNFHPKAVSFCFP